MLALYPFSCCEVTKFLSRFDTSKLDRVLTTMDKLGLIHTGHKRCYNLIMDEAIKRPTSYYPPF